MFVQQWDGKKWNKVSDWIEPMTDVVRPMLEEAAAKYISDKKDWPTQKCEARNHTSSDRSLRPIFGRRFMTAKRTHR
jgi:hypothetical protein